MNETTTTFGELIKSGAISVTDGYRAKNSELNGDGLIFLRAGHVTDAHIDFTGVERFDKKLTAKLQDKTSRVGDVIVTTKGNSTGRTSFVDATMPVFVYSPHLSRWRVEDKTRIDCSFLRYWSRSPEFVNQMRGLATSTDMAPYLSLRDQQRLEITLPHIDEQRAIAAVLGPLDDKIEQNRRTAAKLEALARAIFRAWFVEFAPVHAKAAGATSFPGLPPAAFAALPTTLTDSPVGAIPEAWEAKAIGDVVTIRGGATPSTKIDAFWDGGKHAWATPKDLSNLTLPVLLDTAHHITDSAVECISSGLLPAGTVLMSSRAPVGYLAVAAVPTAINQGFIAMVCDGPLPNVYVLRWAESAMDAIKGNASGTTFPEISKRNFRPLQIVVPQPTVVEAFKNVTAPMHELMVICERESRQLAAIRDDLLPRLLSGKVRVL